MRENAVLVLYKSLWSSLRVFYRESPRKFSGRHKNCSFRLALGLPARLMRGSPSLNWPAFLLGSDVPVTTSARASMLGL